MSEKPEIRGLGVKEKIIVNLNHKPDPAGHGTTKLININEAIRRYIQPGMIIHLAAGIGGPSAAICELIRQFRGKNPAFTIIQSTVTGHALNLVHCGLVKKLICAACIDISNSSRPSKIIQKALEEHTIEFENWSLCSLQQRLMAGAFGFPFIPTKSISGSDIASDNYELFKEIQDPFGSENTTGIIKALNPDISIIHGCVSDPDGNIILSAPYGDDVWGPLASTGGVLATVEKIVSSDFIKKYAALVKIPGYLVKSLSVAPLGVHPFSLTNPGIECFDPYEKDGVFLEELHEASLKKEFLDQWLKTWITDCDTHQTYLEKIGEERIEVLKHCVSKEIEVNLHATAISSAEPLRDFTSEEMMFVAVAREIRKSVEQNRHKTILAGAGVGVTAAWLAYYQLKAKGCEVELITGNGLIGYSPLPGESVLSSEAGVRSAKILTDTVMTHGVFVGGKNNRCLSVLGTGQIDKYGNINSTKTNTGKFLVGSGGANDAVNAQEVIVVLTQSKDRFVETLSYVTGRGDAVTTVISTMGVFRKKNSGEALCLEACLPGPWAPNLEEKVKEVEMKCGWSLEQTAEINEIAPPSAEELKLLRWLLARPAG
jgi:acyl CoA:acetate/3-ketoacid CoA transferase alpha subunit/acyl CoA:acetate/3-ketoacid CoA transferase beta subunit